MDSRDFFNKLEEEPNRQDAMLFKRILELKEIYTKHRKELGLPVVSSIHSIL
jgi:hypothetical protein